MEYNFEHIEESVSEKYKKRHKRKHPKMKVSGKSVLNLQRVIFGKSKANH